METLSPAFRRQLRARAHGLHPVVSIGHHGLTPSVIHEIDVALTAHELIKVRVFNEDRYERESMLTRIAEALDCAPVQQIGKLLVLWRPRPASEQAKPRQVSNERREDARATAAPRRRRAGTAKVATPGDKARTRKPEPKQAPEARIPGARPSSRTTRRTSSTAPVDGSGDRSVERRRRTNASKPGAKRNAQSFGGTTTSASRRRRRSP